VVWSINGEAPSSQVDKVYSWFPLTHINLDCACFTTPKIVSINYFNLIHVIYRRCKEILQDQLIILVKSLKIFDFYKKRDS